MEQTGYTGTDNNLSGRGEFNATRLMIEQVLARVNTCTLVKIVAVTNAGAVSPVGFVDVQPLVNQLDGSANSVPHGVLYGLPYFRIQGGANAVILDPQVGDIGIAIFADRDISAVVASKAQNNPGSARRFDMADGLYLGGVLNGTPTQYVQFSAAGISLVSGTAVNITAPSIVITGTLTNNGKAVGSTHTHLENGAGNQTNAPT